jgi:hypothetical protein
MGRARTAVAGVQGEQSDEEERHAADPGGEGRGVGGRDVVDHAGATDAEGQQGQSEREVAESGSGVSRGDVVVHGGLPSSGQLCCVSCLFR